MYLPPNKDEFDVRIQSCTGATWTSGIDANENSPINCITWYEALASASGMEAGCDGARVELRREQRR